MKTGSPPLPLHIIPVKSARTNSIWFAIRSAALNRDIDWGGQWSGRCEARLPSCPDTAQHSTALLYSVTPTNQQGINLIIAL